MKAAVARSAAARPKDDEAPVELARRAFQLGFSSAMAKQGSSVPPPTLQAVERATSHVGDPVELDGLIKEALRW